MPSYAVHSHSESARPFIHACMYVWLTTGGRQREGPHGVWDLENVDGSPCRRDKLKMDRVHRDSPPERQLATTARRDVLCERPGWGASDCGLASGAPLFVALGRARSCSYGVPGSPIADGEVAGRGAAEARSVRQKRPRSGLLLRPCERRYERPSPAGRRSCFASKAQRCRQHPMLRAYRVVHRLEHVHSE